MAAALVGCGDDGGAGGGDLFPVKPECSGAMIAALQGMHPQVISSLAIGSAADGFDLDRDGKPDNKLAAVGSLAKSAIDDALKNYSIVIPIEFFDLDAAAADACVKFAVYLGQYVTDADDDGKNAFVERGDCNDHNAAVHPGATEIVGNFIDDDCDGLADEDEQNNPSDDEEDRDGDGVTIKDGDCDDTNPMVHPGMPEICGDGLDNDCDGVADRTERNGQVAVCSPFDPGQADIPLDPLSFVNGAPAIAFRDGVITSKDGKLVLEAGPSIFSVNIPVSDGINLDLRITGAQIKADVVQMGNAIVLANGHLGGVIDAKTSDTIRGLDVDAIGLLPENSLLDATFANLLGPLLALPKAKESVTKKYPNCRTPDIDVDQDGLEAFCDSNPDDMVKVVDVCIDGNGTEFTDVLDGAGNVTMQCTEAQVNGKARFVDGISVELNFSTTAVKSLKRP
ncbi:MAG: putative metal-binding motif-containing protein [Deltaproteobacteria bacterium]|nr:putative metal-binding motif-containing protein [Deltaproteobacteria bacterium]MCW5803135.1 putative metal-binding motif-containing protein [Deltaproteobacteria bacterium]